MKRDRAVTFYIRKCELTDEAIADMLSISCTLKALDVDTLVINNAVYDLNRLRQLNRRVQNS